MIDVIQLIAPIFIIILIGYVIAHFDLFSKANFSIISLFIIKISLPCLLIFSISTQDFNSLIQVPYLFTYTCASLVIFILTLFIYRTFFQFSMNRASVMAMGTSMSNTGFIGGGLLYSFLGAKAAVYFGMTFLVENFVIFLLFLICSEIKSKQLSLGKKIINSLYNVIKNPIIISLIIGFIFSLFSITLPTSVLQVLKPIGQTTMPLGLLVIGGSLYGITLKSQQHLARDVMITAGLKLLLMPVSVYLIFQFMPNVTSEMIFAGTLLSSVSMVGLYGIFGQQNEMKSVPTILLLTSFLSILSISTVIHFLR